MKINTEDSGQALIELSLAAVVLCIFVFGIIDFSRAVYDVEVIQNLAAEGSSMASRGAAPLKTAQTVVTDAGNDLSMSTMGCVIVTAVTNTGAGPNPFQVTAQGSQCGIAASSKVGCLKGQGGCNTSTATLPVEAGEALQASQSLYVTEIFYKYNTITPVMGLLGGNILPAQLYSAAYY
jgi:TadE-like protein